jgi:tetratricopeptide (TPR) repeat protein/mono/diheme cytochrome c family protein
MGFSRLMRLAIAASAAVAACGGPDASEGVADNVRDDLQAATVAQPQAGRVTFNRDIAPILFEECAGCHRPHTAAPFSLLNYQDARPLAQRIAAVTATGFMPPWLPEPGYVEYADARTLSNEQIALIRRWVEEGAEEGDPEDLPPIPDWTEGWQLGSPDLVIEMPVSFELPPGGADVFRNFVIPIPVTSARYVRAVELRPESPRAVHHAVMMVDRSPASRRLDELDPAPGYESHFHSGSAENPGGFFLGWTPGKVPHPGTEEMSWRLEEGTDFVVQLHMRPTGHPERVSASVGFYFAEQPPVRTPALIALSSRTIDISPGQKDYTISESYVLPVDVEVYSLYPHAHYLGKHLEGFAILPDGTKQWLLQILDWDFDWQDEYRLLSPITLPKGSTIRMRFIYDNSSTNPRNPNRPPKRVVFGRNSTDEMGDLLIQVVTRESADLTLLQLDYAVKWSEIRLAGLRHALRLNPDNAIDHFKMGVALAERGSIDEAVRHYTRALEIDSRLAEAHSNLGNVWRRRGELDAAIAHYRRALKAKPELAAAHYNLGVTLGAQRKVDEAVRHYRSALEVDRNMAKAHNNLGELLMAEGKSDEALGHLRRAVEIRSEFAEAHNNLAILSARAGRIDDAIEHFRVTTRLRPDWPGPMVLLAEILATHPDSRIRDASEAITLAKAAADLTGHHPGVLDVLAASYASAGEFDRAVATAENALAAATTAGADVLADRIQRRLELYRQSKPFVASRGESTPPR